jgi:signal transduction histidine kinase
MIASLRIRERLRTTVITGLMLVSLLMMGLLSHQTYIAVTSQKQLVDDVLKDYSSLAAEEFIRRSTQVTNYGFYPLLGYLARISPEKNLPGREKLMGFVRKWEPEDRDELTNAVDLANGFFRFLPGTNQLEFTDQQLPESVRTQLLADLQSFYHARESNEKRIYTFHTTMGNEHFNFVYVIIERESKLTATDNGFFTTGIWINNAKALEWLDYFVTAEPLLPSSLTDGKLENESVFVKLMSGKDMIYSQGNWRPGGGLVSREFSEDSSVIYGDMELVLGIDPDAGASLIIGGVPEARLPLIYGSAVGVFGSLWILSALLMIVALVLLYRERSLAYLRSDFVSRVSHELRTPLAQIMMFAQTLLLDRVRNDEDRKRSLEVIDKEALRLSHLVDNILQFSRVERGQVDVNMVRQPLYPLVREIADQFRPMMKEGRLVISSDVNDDVEVQMDVDAFRQMFVNLLDNAVKYSPNGEDVDICLSKTEDRIDVAIEDRGPGVPKKERRRIWEPYYRATDVARNAVGGTGIGLAVVNELARLQAAYVGMTERQGGGSRFVIGFNIAGHAA